MASGFGIHGGPGRCYPIWMDFSECMSKAEDPKSCKDFRDDYLECLHHRKEFTKLNQFFREEKRQRDGGSNDAHGHGGNH
ncbi:hypothetical protein ABPG75_003063 [Micractinium tetrahymenae]